MSSMTSMLTLSQCAMSAPEAVKVVFRPPPGLPPPPGLILPPGLDIELESAPAIDKAEMLPAQLPRLLGAGPMFHGKALAQEKQVQLADTEDATETWSSDCSTADTAEVAEALPSSTSSESSLSSPCCEACTPDGVLKLATALMAFPPTPTRSDAVDEVYQPGCLLRSEMHKVVPKVLHLADTIEEPTISICPECPSVGSAGHHLGLCKPCDFVHRGSCRTGAACKFCHLCGPEENKQRKKEKRSAVRTVKRWERAAGGLW
mmetsp:Transcript_26456/g.57703  ORF Transcript_26456/g.57703 Transcript_26456/m.57703 type:complete len:261 (-) Transcript_26456:219-1001(-)